MTRLFRSGVVPSLLLASLLLPACANFSSATSARPDAAYAASTCDDPAADQCIVLACLEGECGVFGCEDVDPEAVTHAPSAHGVELTRGYRPPVRGPGFNRNWRSVGIRDGARSRMTLHFRYRQGFLPAFPRLEGKLIKHHLFPQATEFREWFRDNGIDVHAWTMVIPEHEHLRIHGSSGRGGLWNEAWRQFMKANQGRQVSQKEIFHKAFDLAFHFGIAGPITSYEHPIVPVGPQIHTP